MRPRILLSCLDKNITQAHRDYCAGILGRAGESCDIKILIPRGEGKLWGTVPKDSFVELPGEYSSRALPAALRSGKALSSLYSAFPFHVMHTSSDFDQFLFTYWRLLSGRRFFIVRSWPWAQDLPKNLFNRLFYNQLVEYNFFPDKKILEGIGPLKLKQTCIDQGGDYLEHFYKSLVIPNGADWSHIRLTYVTNFYFNQKSPDALIRLLRRYEGCDQALLDRIHFVIVDDGSPITFEIPKFDLNIKWLRIDRDIRWNQPGARNIGVAHAKSDNIILTDIDHEFPEETLKAAAELESCGRNIYKFRLSHLPKGKVKGSANIFLMSRAQFLKYWGYDEEFSGHYGFEDSRFFKNLVSHGCRVKYFNPKYECHARRDIGTEEYHSLVRDFNHNSPIDKRKKFEMRCFGGGHGHSRNFLGSEYRVLYENKRPVTAEPPLDRMWGRLGVLRRLFGDM